MQIADPPLSVMLADYLRYLLRGTQAFLRQRTGCDIWENLTKPPEVISSHSNRWGAGPQQIFKKAAIQAELVAKGNLECLRFVGKAHAITSFTLFPTLSLNCGALFKVCPYLQILQYCNITSHTRMAPNLSYVMRGVQLLTYQHT